MAKNETKETYKDTKTAQNNAGAEYNALQADNKGETDQNEGRSDESRDTFRSLNEGLISNPTEAVPGISSDRFKPASEGYTKLASDGGYDPARRSSIMENVGGFKELGRTGGLDDNATSRMRGLGVADEFAVNGGYSDSDRANIRSKALSPISSYASTTNDELARRRSVQGGFGPGFDSASRAIRRDTSRAIADTSLNTELDIKDRVNSGRQWGSSQVAGNEGNLQTLRTGNMFRGLQGANDAEMGLQEGINRGTVTGLGGMRATAGDMTDVDRTNAGIAEGNINRNISQRNLGIGGMRDIYGADDANYNRSQDRSSGLVGEENQTNLGYLQPRTNLATQPGIGGNIMRGIGTAAGVGASLFNPSSNILRPKYPTYAGT